MRGWLLLLAFLALPAWAQTMPGERGRSRPIFEPCRMLGVGGAASSPYVAGCSNGPISLWSNFATTLPQPASVLNWVPTFTMPNAITATRVYFIGPNITDPGGGSSSNTLTGFPFAPTVTVTGAPLVSPVYTVTHDAAIYQSAVVGTGLPHEVLLNWVPSFIATAAGNVGSTGTNYGLNGQPVATVSTDNAAALTTAFTLVRSNSQFQNTKSGNAAGLTVTANIGLDFQDPSYTATGVLTVTDNIAVNVAALTSTSGNKTVTRNTGVKSLLNAGTGGTVNKALDLQGTAEADFGGPLILKGSAPTCGTGCSAVTGTDRAFKVTTGSAVSSVTVNFSATLSSVPICAASDSSTATTMDISSISTSAIVFTTAGSVTSISIWATCFQNS